MTGTNGDRAGDDPLLVVEGLEMHYRTASGLLGRSVDRVRAVDGVSFDLDRGEALGVIGESGSGKTTLAHALLRIEEPTGGTVRFDGERVADLTGADLRAFRRRVQLVVQDPNEAFNPRMPVGEAVAEPLQIHGLDEAARRRAIVADVLERVGMSADDVDRYPHEFSVGELQRLAIARALVLDPDLIVADEPTSALDGRTREGVLALLDTIRREYDVSVLVVSHDIDTVRRFCDRVAVMYLGELVEQGRAEDVLDAPAHPYTRVLVDSIPDLDPDERPSNGALTEAVPDAAAPPDGCRFHPRCPEVIPPADLDLPRETWQSVAAFRFSLETRSLPGSLDATDPESLDSEAIRDAFGLTGNLPAEHAERELSEAIAALCRGEYEEARTAAAEAFPTPCEQSPPAVSSIDGRSVSCHRYDPASDAEPHPR